ncbi:hypothetical protein LTS18_012735, partial [Coniosporium uncinatum]
TCYICNQKMGACVQCGNKSCYAAFHVTCARRSKLFLKMKSSHGGSGITDASVLKAFCDKHVPPDWRREHDVETATAEAKDFYRRTMRNRRWADSQTSALALAEPQHTAEDEMAIEEELAAGNKRKRGQTQRAIWRLPSGAPVVPQAVYDRVETSLARFTVRKRKDFVAECCKYWTLKREARRGAALLKRLQRDMESFSSLEITRRDFVGMGAAGGPKLQRRIEFAEGLEKEMEDILAICKIVRQREEQKLQDAEILNRLVDTVYFPIAPLLLPILEKAQGLDQLKSYFKGGFTDMKQKLEERYYTTVASFFTDINAVFRNAIGFDTFASSSDANDQLNGGSVPHNTLTAEQKDRKKNAKRIIKAIQPMLNEASCKETELGGKPAEKDFSDLEALLDRSLSSRRESVIASTADNEMRDAPEDEDNGASQLHMPNGRLEASPQLSDTKAGAEQTNGALNGDDNMDINIDPALLGEPPRDDTTDE